MRGSSRKKNYENGWTVSDPNRQNLRTVALALSGFDPDPVFIGGSVVGLLLTDTAARVPRVTVDVDVVMEARTRGMWMTQILDGLRRRGLKEVGDSEVICRWRLGTRESGVLVDVMPTDEAVLGFSNRWYPHAVDTAVLHDMDGVSIKVVDAVHFIATKIEAFRGRGGGDFYASHDIEDILAVVDGRAELVDELSSAHEEVRSAVAGTLIGWLADDDFRNALEGHVERGRDAVVVKRLDELARR